MKEALIVFVKNLVKGKVKTRLAATAGDDKAYKVYNYLLNYTYSVVTDVPASKYIFYSDHADEFKGLAYKSFVQTGVDLGDRMQHAFKEVFDEGYHKVVIIGSDTLEITPDLIKEAFQKLNDYDVVIGPALDGGYYLLGMTSLYQELFEDIAWSSPTVLESTLQVLRKSGHSFTLLKALNDIDTEEDWLPYDGTIVL